MARVLGLSPVEQGLYEALFIHASVTASELAALATEHGWDEHDDGPVLERFLERKLLIALPDDPHRYAATPPHAALDATLDARSRDLARVRERMLVLSSRFHRRETRATEDPMIEVVRGSAAMNQCLADLSTSVRHEIWGFDAPPYFGAAAGQGNIADTRYDQRELSYRALYNRASAPMRIPTLSDPRPANEQVRVGEVPVKIFVYDRRTVLMPLDHVTIPITAFVVVREPALVNVLCAMYELYWEHAVPVNVRDGQIHTQDAPEVDRELLSLLVAGLTDKAIADLLGWVDRTVRRRVSEIMTRLGATTRFQAGYQAVARGWLSTNSEGVIEPAGGPRQ